MRLRQLGSDVRVTVTADEVADFNSRWPCSSLPEVRIDFVFDSSGDLVDIFPDHIDGPEALALCEDAQTFMHRKLHT